MIMKLSLAVFLVTSGCCAALLAQNRAGTQVDRAALFEYILAKTLEREAFSPVQSRITGWVWRWRKRCAAIAMS
jgi:hypothetical protein